MDMEAALRARLLVDAPVAALVAARVDWVERPQAATLPAVTLQIISVSFDEHMQGFQALQFAHVQVDCWAKDSEAGPRGYATAKALSVAVIAASVPSEISNGINFRRASVRGMRDLGETTPTGFVHRKSFDLIIPFSPA